MIFLFIKHETSFDKHLSKRDRLYRIIKKEVSNKGVEYDKSLSYPLGQALKHEVFPSEKVVNICFDQSRHVNINNTDNYMEDGIVFTDSVFCKFFDVHFLHGDASTLDEPNTVILTSELAEKYFDKNNPVGEKLVLAKNMQLTIRGVIENPPANTHLRYKMLVSGKSLHEDYLGINYDNWGTNLSNFSTYLLINKNEDPATIANQIGEVYAKHRDEEIANQVEFFVQPVNEIHLDTRFHSFAGSYTTSKKFIWIFSSVGLVILIIALINFINLSVVQAIKRTREVGLRKVVGASRKKLMYQFLLETIVIVIIAEILALIIVEMTLPALNNQLGELVNVRLYGELGTVIFLVGILVFVSVAAGIFPSLYMSRHKPIEALRSKVNITKNKSLPAYKTLVILQFFITQILLISILVINQQVNFIKNKDLGFDKKNLVLVDLPRNDSLRIETFKNELKQYHNIANVSLSIGSPTSGSNITASYDVPDDEEKYYANIKVADTDYLNTYGIQMKTGKWFSPEIETRNADQVVVNETLTKKLGYSSPDSIIGTVIDLFDQQKTIIGVTEDFHVKSLREELFPVIFYYLPDYFFVASVKLHSDNFESSLAFIKKTFQKSFPEYTYSYRIYEDYLNTRYSNELRTFNLLKLFSLIAIILASMGLFGLVSYMMVQKTKDIGIRKALGATSNGIIYLYVFRYIKIIFFASLFAWPVAYYLMREWLKDYAYHINLNILFFLAGLMILLLIALISILFQTIKTANTNPSKSLRYE
jgi:ABC-type antimicrobial peptide transport system permease subunit